MVMNMRPVPKMLMQRLLAFALPPKYVPTEVALPATVRASGYYSALQQQQHLNND